MPIPCCLICYEECGCDIGSTSKSAERALFGRSKNTCLNVMCAPLALMIHSFYAFFVTCVFVYVARCLNHSCCFLCLNFEVMKNWYEFTDKKFPPDEDSLGRPLEDKSNEQIGGGGRFVWKRAKELIERPVLFQKDVEPKDVVQGNVGNCWLMSALSCMAEFPGLVDKVFLTREYSTRGKYRVMLYDGFSEKFRVITVDDFFPVKLKNKKPGSTSRQAAAEQDLELGEGPLEKLQKEEQLEQHLENDGSGPAKALNGEVVVMSPDEFEWEYANPVGKEIWVAVLEKAFAKFRGSFKNLEGGNALWAFRALTGDPVFRLIKCTEPDKQGMWERFELVDKHPHDLTPVSVRKTKYSLKTKNLFDFLRTYDRSKALVSASQALPESGVEERDEDTGLIKGHAYSILASKRVGRGVNTFSDDPEFELVQLRNPWGEFEWKGKWSDDDDMWNKHPKVAGALRPERDLKDGTFWMEFSDFLQHFDNIDVCDRTVNYSDFHLDVHENRDDALQYMLGPAKGCVQGCTKFWCFCEGIKTLYFGNVPHKHAKKIHKYGRDDDLFDKFSQASKVALV